MTTPTATHPKGPPPLPSSAEEQAAAEAPPAARRRSFFPAAPWRSREELEREAAEELALAGAQPQQD